MRHIAFAHPGKLGDALYSLPTIRAICDEQGAIADFYTSAYCTPLRRLFEYQDCISCVVIADWYKVERMDCGCQPWYIPIPDSYDRVYQLGFKRVPDRPIPNFIWYEQMYYDAHLPIHYQYPDIARLMAEPYICLAPRGDTSYTDLFSGVVRALETRGVKTLVIGGNGDYSAVGARSEALDYTGTDLLETVSLLSYAAGFVGLMSSQLVLANGFIMPKVAPHDGHSWDMRHVVRSATNHYPVNPSVDSVLQLLKGGA